MINLVYLNNLNKNSASIPIPDLYNTGQDDYRNVVSDGSTDGHYFLISSIDKDYPGPEVKVSLSTGFPMDRWVPNDKYSKWIAPRTDAGNFNEAGLYVYRTQFDLSKFKAETAVIKGLWSSDNNGIDILINGISTGYYTPIEAYYGMFPFEISEGFNNGINTIDFVVNNVNAPTGLRVILNGQADPKEYVFYNEQLIMNNE
jgi:hypothetical protein